MAGLVQQWKHADLARADSVHLDQRTMMKVKIQSVGIGEQEVRAQHEIELAVSEWEDRQRGRHIALGVDLEVVRKEGSGILSYIPMALKIPVEIL
jgi:hypothetical protein